MPLDVQARHLGLRDFDLGRIDFLARGRFHHQALLGGGRLDQVQPLVVAGQRLTRPIAADGTKQPMIRRIPFRGSRRVMRDGHFQVVRIDQAVLEGILPQPRANRPVGLTRAPPSSEHPHRYRAVQR